jgi:hypothetical protein
MSDDKIRLVRYSEFKTGTGFLTRKFDVIDDVIISKSDLLKNLSKPQVKQVFKQATEAPKFLSDDVFKNRIKLGKQTTSIDEYIGVFTKKSATKKIPLDELLNKLDITEFSGVQRISVRTGKDLLIKAKTKLKPTIYDDSLESVSGFGKVKEAEKTILIKKGTKTFSFEGIGLSYSQADELAEGVIKAQKTTKTTKKIVDLKLLGKQKYAGLPAKEKIYKLTPKQTTTSLQEDVIFIKAKQKGTKIFTSNADDYSKFLAKTKEKGLSQTITFQGDETIISPVTKYKSDVLTFAGKKGKGQIIKTSVKGLPDEYTLKIASKADDLPKPTKFAKIKVSDVGTKASAKTDDFIGLNQVSLGKGKEIKLLNDYVPTLKEELKQALTAYEKQATPLALKRIQELSTQISIINARPAIIGASFAKRIELNKAMTKKIDEFAKQNNVLSLDDLKRIDDFSKKTQVLSLDDLKRIDDFSKTGVKLDKKSLEEIKKWEKKFGSGITETKIETFGGDRTFLSDEAVQKYLDNIYKPKPKPKIKPLGDITFLSDEAVQKYLDNIYKPKPKPKIKPLGDITTKQNGKTLLIIKTKTIQDNLTKKATKNITDDKLLNIRKSKTQTVALEKTKTDSITRTKQDFYTKTRQIKDYAKAKQFFKQPQLNFLAKTNVSRFQTKQRIGAKTISQTQPKTKQTQDTITNEKTNILDTTKAQTATLTDTTMKTIDFTGTKTIKATKTKISEPTPTLTPTPLITPPIITPIPKIPRIKIPFIPNQLQKQEKTRLYVSQVREKNNSKWKTVSKPMPYNKSFNQGLEVADNTIGQSVRNVYKKTIKKFVPDDPTIKDYKFRNKKYKSKIPSNPVKIELRQFAIDTLGEKQGLSIAKYLAQKKKNKMTLNNINKRFINKKRLRLL